MYSAGNEISNRIKKIMLEQKINQNQLARILNITQPAVSKYLTGRIPPPYVLLKLSKLSGKTIEWFLTGQSSTVIQKKKVMEKPNQYHIRLTINEKFNLLSEEMKEHVTAIIDALSK